MGAIGIEYAPIYVPEPVIAPEIPLLVPVEEPVTVPERELVPVTTKR